MPRSAGRGTADKQGPGAAHTAGRASFRADVRCLCISQVGGAEPRSPPLPGPGLGLTPPPSCLLNILAILGPGILEGQTPGESQNWPAVAPAVGRPREGTARSPSQSAQPGGAPAPASQPRALLAAE